MTVAVVADRYHYFVPSAPNLVFSVPKYNSLDEMKTIYQYRVTASNRVDNELAQSLVDYPEHEVYVNGVLRSPTAWYIKPNYIHMTYIKGEYPYPGWPLPEIGSIVRVVGKYVNLDPDADRFHHLSLRSVLIQGAHPRLQSVFNEHHNFQGGFRMKHIMLTQPKFGRSRYCDYQTGFDYEPPVGFEGVDSFSYCLETPYGQRSDAGCINIEIGNVDIGEL